MCSFDIQLVVVLKLANATQILSSPRPPNSPAHVHLPPPPSGMDSTGLAWHDPLGMTFSFTARVKDEGVLTFDRRRYERALLHSFPGRHPA